MSREAAEQGMVAAQRRLTAKVTGTVQGVGFRPFVYGLAREMGIHGWVANTTSGVVIEAEGGEELETFLNRIRSEAPAAAMIDAVKVEEAPAAAGGGRRDDGFVIRQSEDLSEVISPVPADIAVCPDCLAEMSDPKDRRHRYPFINCTNCGPRYSIVRSVPYDRPNTTMAAFSMCPECRAEYEDPGDRRFHAQPSACPVCGPRLRLMDGDGSVLAEGEEAVTATIAALGSAAIVAVKGLGGFHLTCDATDETAVARLRSAKRRSNKPFALMARDVQAIKEYCEVNAADQLLLASTESPIVIMPKRSPDTHPPAGSPELAPSIAPGSASLGFMLPYTPLHYLLFFGKNIHWPALVMTSGNRADEPIATDDTEALRKLHGIADLFLTHNRDIYMRVDDSILRGGSILRRSRGYAPRPIRLSDSVVADGGYAPDILAVGADLKNSFCLLTNETAVLSQHIGDLDSEEALGFLDETLQNLAKTFRVRPRIIAHDLHPDYRSTGLARSLAGSRRIGVQHHHAHIASCMAENGRTEPVIGVAFDGAGYGSDGATWGGEFLIADLAGFERGAHLRYAPMPGGDRAAREPWRMALAYLYMAVAPTPVDWSPEVSDEEIRVVERMLAAHLNSPHTSSAGRLFDAVSALLGLCTRNTFEGEAAMALEAEAAAYLRERPDAGELDGGDDLHGYPFAILLDRSSADPDAGKLDLSPAIGAIVDAIRNGTSTGLISLRFHNTVASAVVKTCQWLKERTGIETVALSGGVFQNSLLLDKCAKGLTEAGFTVLTHSTVPANDGGIALGQAVIARHKNLHQPGKEL